MPGPLPLVASTCQLRYGTAGTTGAAGMDRGRALAAMDQELATALQAGPPAVVKNSYTSGSPVAMATSIFWGSLAFGPVQARTARG